MIYDGTNYQYLTSNPPITFFASNPGTAVGATGNSFKYGFFPIFSRETTDAATMPYMLYSFNGMRIDYYYGTTTAQGNAILSLGDTKLSNANKNMCGMLRLEYSRNVAVIRPDITENEQSTATHNPTYWYLPDLGSTDRTFASILRATATGTEIKPVYVAANGTIEECTYTISASTAEGSAGYLSYYNDAHTIQYTPNVEYINANSEVTGNRTSAGAIRGIRITGTCYGNDAAYLASTTKGDFSLGDPGPQIQFGNSAGTAKAAIIYTNHDSNG
jgi:hypothetical protein